jgi:hypothetical protein
MVAAVETTGTTGTTRTTLLEQPRSLEPKLIRIDSAQENKQRQTQNIKPKQTDKPINT